MKKGAITFVFILIFYGIQAQSAKPVYHPCFLMDSVDARLEFIKRNTQRIFIDSFDCRQTLLDSIAEQFNQTGNRKYLDALNYISIYGKEQVEGLLTDIMRRYCERNFSQLLQELYSSKGSLQALEKELVSAMNMIIDGRPLKQKFIGRMNVEIEKAKEKKDSSRLYYLEKLKTRIEQDRE